MVTYFQSNTAFYVNYVVLFQVTKFRENLVTKKDKEEKKRMQLLIVVFMFVNSIKTRWH